MFKSILLVTLLVCIATAQMLGGRGSGKDDKNNNNGDASPNASPCDVVRCAAGECRVRNGRAECAVAGSSQALIGALRDLHGCIPSAGYSWCEDKGRCIPPGSKCAPDTNVDKDRTACKKKVGYSWCEAKQKCIIPMNERCVVTVGGKDENGCIGGAGYTWCGIKGKCLRKWEEKCEKLGTCPPNVDNSTGPGCDEDSDCSDNQKCCSGVCAIPTFQCPGAQDGYTWCPSKSKCLRLWEEPCDNNIIDIVGRVLGSKDANGCIPTAGYQWCDSKKKCLRSWEEACEQPPAEDFSTPLLCDNGASRGFQWCNETKTCVQPWVVACPSIPVLGRKDASTPCLADAGYQWCEHKKKCLRQWEEPCIQPITANMCLGGAGYSWCEAKNKCLRVWEEPCVSNSTRVGGRDEKGCIPSAGYSWCDAKSKCLRAWEEKCEVPPADSAQPTQAPIGGKKGVCLGSAGYTWCEDSQNCVRLWEKPCPSLMKPPANILPGEPNPNGNNADLPPPPPPKGPKIGAPNADGCIPSAGYQWCDAKSKCLRLWEEKCESPNSTVPMPGAPDANGCATGTGYQWCANKSKCVRLWEEDCSSILIHPDVLTGDKKCIGGAGYQWCAPKSKCLRLWEEPCEEPLLDSNNCLGSAGYSWCGAKSKCIRLWEEKCEPKPSAIGGKDGACISGAGYSWCETKSKCLRVWEEECPVAAKPPVIGGKEGKCLLGAGYSWCEAKNKCLRLWEESCNETSVIGGKDEKGCIPSAGYSWCDAKSKCLRAWEEKCEAPVAATDAPRPGQFRDENGCIPSAGFTWCAAKSKCVQPWAEPCVALNVKLGQVDAGVCLGSAGYSWCAAKKKCLRSWEETCELQSSSSTCISGAGYSWCESSKKCVRLWEEPCGIQSAAIRGADLHGCISGAGYSWCAKKNKCIRMWEAQCADENVTVGASSSTCLGSAGYSWCEAKSKCLRTWEESCDDKIAIVGAPDDKGCYSGAGYQWCEAKSKCLRSWEEKCESPAPATTATGAPVIGGQKGKCLGSAGYSWCDAKSKCLRTWEESCPTNTNIGAAVDENGCVKGAGYQWCSNKNKCVRLWEEPCPSALGVTTSKCISTAGYSWCNQKAKCLRLWEEPCGDSDIIVEPQSVGAVGGLLTGAKKTSSDDDGDSCPLPVPYKCNVAKSTDAAQCIQDILESSPELYTRYVKARESCNRIACDCRSKVENVTFIDATDDGEGVCLATSNRMTLVIVKPTAAACKGRGNCEAVRRMCLREVIRPLAMVANKTMKSAACGVVSTSCTLEQLKKECTQDKCQSNDASCDPSLTANSCKLMDTANTKRGFEMRLAGDVDSVTAEKQKQLKTRISDIANIGELGIGLQILPGSVVVQVTIADDAAPADPSKPSMDVVTASTEVASDAQLQSDYGMEPNVQSSYSILASNSATTNTGESSTSSTTSDSSSFPLAPTIVAGLIALIALIAGVVVAKRHFAETGNEDLGVHMNEMQKV